MPRHYLFSFIYVFPVIIQMYQPSTSPNHPYTIYEAIPSHINAQERNNIWKITQLSVRMKFIYLSSFFRLFLCVSMVMMIHVANGQSFINSTCRSFTRNDPNINHNFCTTSLQAAPASGCARLRGLGMISIRLIRYNVTDTRCHIKQLLKNKKWNPYVRQCLSDCFELFSDAIPSVKQAMRSYNDKRFNDANVQISSIMTASTTCEDGFKERKGVVSPLTKRNNDVFQLSAISLSVMQLIQRGTGWIIYHGMITSSYYSNNFYIYKES